MIWALKLVHSRSDVAAVAAEDMTMFCTKALIHLDEQKKHVAVMTTSCLPENILHQTYADPTSSENLCLVPNQLQTNLKRTWHQLRHRN